jgi:AbiV family abortive infection protein
MNAATANARRLAQDARALFSNERFPSAASLAALSIEESGKVVILRRFLTAGPDDIKSLWKEYRSHTKKNINWILPQLAAQGARRLEDFRLIVDDSSDHPRVLDATKQIGFYTDCFNQAHWSVPAEVIDRELAKGLVTAAEVLAPERVVAVLELELWAKHMKPVWNKKVEWMQQALVNWYSDMQAAGLAPAGMNVMSAFIREGLTGTQADKLHTKDT